MEISRLYLPQKCLRIKLHDDADDDDDSRGSSNGEYYQGGVSVTVPFHWELQPGTPKVKSSKIPGLPPLTPPPSYFYSTTSTRGLENKYHSKPKLVNTIVPKRYRRKPRVQLSSPSSSSSSGSSSGSTSPRPRSYSVPSSPIRGLNLEEKYELSRGRLLSDSRAEEGDLREYKSYSISSPCFGRGAGTRSGRFCSTLLKVLRKT